MTGIQIIEINDKEWTEQEGLSSKGQRVKGWYERINDGTLFLYKEPRVFESTGFMTQEIWTEFIAYKIGKKLNLEVPEVIPAKKEDKYGVLVKSFLKSNDEFADAKELLSRVKGQQAHNMYFVRGFLLSPHVKQGEWAKFKKMMIFDCLIGNNDRHSENWGVCYDIFSDLLELAPFYDNANCFTSQLDEKNILKYLSNKKLIEKYVKKSKQPGFYLDPFNPHNPNHYETIEHLIKTELDMRDLINELLQNSYIDYVDDIMANIQQLDVPVKYKLSDNRRKVILEILKLRRQKLEEML